MSTTVTPNDQPAIGRVVRRKEDTRLLTGRGHYVSDLQLPRMRHVAFLRSPYGHAKISRIDATAARSAPRVHGVFTGDLPDFAAVTLRALSALPSYVETEQPILARDKVRFSGEPVAAVIAEDRYLAEDALELIDVDYEPLPATVTAWLTPEEPVHAEAPDNVLLQRTFDTGEVPEALAGAHLVVERELVTNRHAGNPMECRAGVALWDGERLTFWSGTQVPHIARNMLAELLGLPEGNVRVIAPDVGGGFGTKAVLYPEDVALCVMARQMRGFPVKWVEDRAEHLLAATHARDHRYLVKAGFSADGELLALDADVTCNVGAYSVYPWTAGIEPLMAGGLLSGPYRLQHYRCTVRGVATNTAPSGPYRGVARPASVFAMESLLDDAAQRLGMSALDIRRRNLITPAEIPYRMPSRLVDDSGWYGECLEKAVATIGYDEFRAEQTRRREAGENPIGLGLACYNELTGLGRAAAAGPRMPFRTGHDACTVRVNPDGRVTVLSGVTSQGQGLETTVAQIVADAVGVPYEDVEVRIGDTNESLWGFGAFSSRQAVIGGGAAHRAGTRVREKILRLAAELYETDADDLSVTGGEIRVAGEQKPLGTLAELARVAYLESNRLPQGIEPGLEATRFYDPIRGAFAAGAQAAVIEVDRTTGELRILKWVCVEDAGTVINPQVVEGQIAGSIAQGLGGALYEHLIYDEAGNLSTGTLMDYLMPTSAEVPDLVIEHLSKPADNPLGVRGVGEGGTLGPNAVLAGALTDALGVRVTHLPLTPAVVWEALR
ncbi:xanthine dehydrogenase family protein molybdopterin-binding subunit [Amycolatopsis acidiphila]|uniref:Xanthine dehydrogenase family protein molybdopterin-binding subunit n=1 Tax=Amycolatopsis acidiphila TaxID=715473 RepID=A0A558AM76_9PSEU|nr:xanthine dehydrogenase family protein molybdopterin-binding subunit [Amycolatopsis acidiphila]TVT25363.1 xanthine dehydrogenase family protein molybdopterin-binding subunit [Amycolatopsis acidiphila]UIJ62495.1 xanthine dehydrogenase family protein molybdopterin-binding subunit [Amycolatopsis acidiphila]GHG83945.1 dehydrogenase [Amycolatopsis acidiphila]